MAKAKKPKVRGKSRYVSTKIGGWTVLEFVPASDIPRHFVCVCECGTIKKVHYAAVINKSSMSCGCGRKKSPLIEKNMSEYRLWRKIYRACLDPDNKHYKKYGAIGIKLVSKWHDFEAFFADLGNRPSEEHVLERTSPDANFSPETTSWQLSRKAQFVLRKLQTVEVDGQVFTIKELSKQTGLPVGKLYHRIKIGLAGEELISNDRPSNGQTVEFGGVLYTIRQLAEKFGIRAKILSHRIWSGMTVAEAVAMGDKKGLKIRMPDKEFEKDS